MNIQEEAYTEAMDEIVRLKKILELRDTEIGALRREITRRNGEIAGLKGHTELLCDVFEEIMGDDGHYPSNAPLRKLVAKAREIAKIS
jgi:hypothetical protein